MRRRSLLMILLLLLVPVLAAGCATHGPTPASAPPPSPSPPSPPPSLSPLATDAAPLSEKDDAPRVVNETIPVRAEGVTEGEACPGAGGAEHCVVTGAGQGTPLVLPVVERPTLLALTVEVDEPAHASGCAWAVLRIREGDAWRSLGDQGLAVSGASPLQVSWSLRGQPAGSEFHLAVYCGSDRHVGNGLVTGYVGWSAPFRVEGVLHAEREADE